MDILADPERLSLLDLTILDDYRLDSLRAL
jgi:hypothetical protein